MKAGGCGLGFAEDMVDAAYVASMVSSWHEMRQSIPGLDLMVNGDTNVCPRSLEELRDGVSRLRATAMDESLSLSSLLGVASSQNTKLQHSLSQPYLAKRQRQVELSLCQSDPSGYALFVSGQSPQAGAWIEAVPSSPTFIMTPELFACSLRNRLGVAHPSIAPVTTCQCGRQCIDNRGIHLQKCKRRADLTIQTHDAVVLEVIACARYSGLDVKREQRIFRDGPSPDDGRGDFVATFAGG